MLLLFLEGWEAAQTDYLVYVSNMDVTLLKAENWIDECGHLAPEDLLDSVVLPVSDLRRARAELATVCEEDAPAWFDCG